MLARQPEDATTRNLALARLHNQLKERDATIGELEAKLEEAQHSHRATLEAQPPKPEVPRPPEPAKKPPELKAVPAVAEPAASTAASTAVVVAQQVVGYQVWEWVQVQVGEVVLVEWLVQVE